MEVQFVAHNPSNPAMIFFLECYRPRVSETILRRPWRRRTGPSGRRYNKAAEDGHRRRSTAAKAPNKLETFIRCSEKIHPP